ncbi:TolB family protein [Marinoscillum sp.]|uniref:TolB family protein n=1 Tax=Marinoscillum sp. TaxID=2024838 RepID=UPI003BA8CAA9
MKHLFYILGIVFVASCQTTPKEASSDGEDHADTLRYAQEVHLKNVRQLTWGGNNAEAYWSFGGDQLIFQSDFDEWGVACDQIFRLDIADARPGYQPPMLSTGLGRTTCAYFLPGDSSIVYGSTHLGDSLCPESPVRSAGGKYVWPIYADYDIFTADLNGNILNQLTQTAGYDAEATVSPKGDRIVFTSMRSGDLELYTMDIDGGNVIQITDELGYDGGAFFSPDGDKLIFRASRPKTEEEMATYKALLAEGLVQPTEMELFVCNADGSDLRQITSLGNANWAPFFHPSGEKVIFSSNHEAERGFPFNLYMINLDGTGLERVTFDSVFDSFAMFSPDGKYLVWASNRFNGGNRDTDLFMAEWVD